MFADGREVAGSSGAHRAPRVRDVRDGSADEAKLTLSVRRHTNEALPSVGRRSRAFKRGTDPFHNLPNLLFGILLKPWQGGVAYEREGETWSTESLVGRG